MWIRIVTGLILGPTFLWALFVLPVAGVQILMAAIIAGAAWESSALIGFKRQLSRFIFMATILGAGIVSLVISSDDGSKNWVTILMAIASVWWLVHTVLLGKFSIDRPGVYGNKIARMGNTGFIMLTTWVALNSTYLHDSGRPLLLVYMLVLIWVADSGAYFAGKFFGTHKLAVRISPGKTIEGLVGAVIAASVFSAIYSCAVLNLSGTLLTKWMLLGVVVTLISVVGDLNESALKRVSGKKDSGSIIPGHGGLFDRIDAITAAAPVFYLGWIIFDWGLAG